MKDYKEHSKYITKLGKRIQQLRKLRKLTQHDLSAITDIPRGQIVKIETGQTNATIVTLLRLSQALDVEINELVNPKFIITSAKSA